MKENAHTKESYDTPTLYVVELSVEKGFATTGESFGDGGGYSPAPEYWN